MARDRSRAARCPFRFNQNARTRGETSGQGFDPSLKAIRRKLKEIHAFHPDVVKRYRAVLLDRIQKAGLPIASDDERLLKEISFFADRADVSEELTRLESHLAQFAHHLRKNEPVGRTLEFITYEMFR